MFYDSDFTERIKKSKKSNSNYFSNLIHFYSKFDLAMLSMLFISNSIPLDVD